MACYLITGGCGFIGSHLADALVARGHAIRVLDDLSTGATENLPSGATLLEGSVADAALVRRAVHGIDGCFHLAAIASVQRSEEDLLGTHRTNLGGTLTLLDAIAASNTEIPFVYASSAAVYGDCPVLPISEDCPKRPQSAYGADKYAGELHAAVATHTRGIPTAGLRFFNVYGPRQRPDSPYSGVVSIFADRIVRGQTLTMYGDGAQTRDLVQVADVVAALLQAMARRLPGAPVFNVCTGQAISVHQLAATIGTLCGRVPDIVHGPARTGEIRHSVGDPRAGSGSVGVRPRNPASHRVADAASPCRRDLGRRWGIRVGIAEMRANEAHHGRHLRIRERAREWRHGTAPPQHQNDRVARSRQPGVVGQGRVGTRSDGAAPIRHMAPGADGLVNLRPTHLREVERAPEGRAGLVRPGASGEQEQP